MHFALIPENIETSRRMAFEGLGGGYIGGGVFQLLQAGLGRAGAAIALGAMFLIGLGELPSINRLLRCSPGSAL